MPQFCDVDAAGAGRDGGDDVVAAVGEVGAGKDARYQGTCRTVSSTRTTPV